MLLTASPLLPSGASATPKDEYGLQERCGSRAEEWFKKEYGGGIVNTKDGRAIASYRNHYNTRLNKCFVVLNYQDLPYKNKKSKPSRQIGLFDLNEKKDYGSFFKFSDSELLFECVVADKICKSQSEWEALIAPFMDD